MALPVLASAAAHTSIASNTMTFTKPASSAVGNLLLVYISHQAGQTVTTPSGWLLRHNLISANAVIKSYTKIVDGTEGASFAFSFSSSASALGQICRITGVDTVNVIDVGGTLGSTGGTTTNGAALTTRLNDCLIVSMAAAYRASDSTYTLTTIPATATSISSQTTGSYRLAGYRFGQATAGAYTGGFVWSQAVDGAVSRLAIRPAGGNVAPTVTTEADEYLPYKSGPFANTATASDVEGSVTYAWTLTKPPGSATTISGGTTATATITPDVPGGYVMTCTVTDSNGATDSDSTTLTVRATHWVKRNGVAKAGVLRTNIGGNPV